MQLPPPIHGASVINRSIKESRKINEAFDIDYIPLHFANEINQIEKFQILKLLKMALYGWMIFTKLLVNKYDLVYFTLSPVGGAFYRDVFFVSIMKLFRVKRVYHLHGKGIKKASEKSLINKFLYRWVFTNAKVIHLSKLLYFDIEQYVNKNRCYFVPNGIKASKYYSRALNNNRPLKLLYFSNMLLEKGVADFLKALHLLKARDLNFYAIFAGAWSQNFTEVKFKQLVSRYDIDKNIEYLGPAYNEEKEKIFQSASIFVFPTKYKNECFPLVLLEAMSFGIPSISTFEGAIPEIIEDGLNGFTVPKNNPQAFAEKILILNNDPELRKKMGHASRERFLKNYTLSHWENNMKNVLKNIITEGAKD